MMGKKCDERVKVRNKHFMGLFLFEIEEPIELCSPAHARALRVDLVSPKKKQKVAHSIGVDCLVQRG